jgi:hypothetical protein
MAIAGMGFPAELDCSVMFQGLGKLKMHQPSFNFTVSQGILVAPVLVVNLTVKSQSGTERSLMINAGI